MGMYLNGYVEVTAGNLKYCFREASDSFNIYELVYPHNFSYKQSNT